MLDATILKHRRDVAVDVSIHLDRGAALGLFGPSGAGKSTVLGCIAGIEQPDGGSIRFGDVQYFPPQMPLHLRNIGYLTQESALFPHLSVAANVCFGLPAGRNGNQPTEWVAELREQLGLLPFWKASAARISGGQARRVALARMLARKPHLVLLDEPFTGIDRVTARDLMDRIIYWRERLGFTLIMVDHEAEVLRRICPTAMVLERGKVIQQGKWEEVERAPATPLLRGLLSPL